MAGRGPDVDAGSLIAGLFDQTGNRDGARDSEVAGESSKALGPRGGASTSRKAAAPPRTQAVCHPKGGGAVSPLQPRAAAELRIASSRTRTARLPLPLPTPLSVSGVGLAGNLVDYYLGPPQQPASVPSFPGHSVRYGFDNVALQLYLRVKRDDAKVVLVLDFGRNVRSCPH